MQVKIRDWVENCESFPAEVLPGMYVKRLLMWLDEAPPPYVPPEKPEEPPPAYFPEEYTMAVEGRSHLVPPNVHVSHYADSNNVVVNMVNY